MIKVIKHGQKEFEHICSRCGCEFTYEYEDIQSEATRGLTNYTSVSYVKCPDCGNICYVNKNNSNNGWPWSNNTPIPCSESVSDINPCKDCDWHKKMITDGTTWYVGDTPCTWCIKNPMKVTCGSIGTDSTTPKLQIYNGADTVGTQLQGDGKITATCTCGSDHTCTCNSQNLSNTEAKCHCNKNDNNK